MKTIHFQFLKPIVLAERNRLRAFLLNAFKKENRSVQSLTIWFCSNDKILKINKKHLKHNYYTDIITFDFSPSPQHPIVSDIFISVDMIRENAQTFHTTTKAELHRVIFHGALHLCGYGDKTEHEKKIMRKKEDKLLSSYFVSRET
jgi:rRNA maturation RNase YbeY